MRNLALLGALYLSQGLPFGFFTQALPVMMRDRGFDLRSIGLASLLTLPWAGKFLWAPLVDRYGLRKSWILPMQVLAALVLVALCGCPPENGMGPVLAGVFLINFLSATQDIATDALAVDQLPAEARGWANGIQVAGYRLGMIVGGGMLLIVYAQLGWRGTFLCMAAIIALASLPVALAREERKPRNRTETGHFLRSPGAARILLLIVTYKLGDAFAVGMIRPFLSDSGFSLSQLGWLLGSVAFTAGLVGSLLGGALLNSVGRKRGLLLFGALQALAIGGYAQLAASPQPVWLVYAVCAWEHLAGGMATAALFTCMMDWSRPQASATDYAVQASAVVIATGLASALSGWSAQALGYFWHFTLAGGLSLTTLALAAACFPTGNISATSRQHQSTGTPLPLGSLRSC